MLELVASRNFLQRLPYPDAERDRLRSAGVLAQARVFLTGAALIAISIDPTEPSRYRALAYSLLIAYFVFSVVALLWLRRRHELPLRSATVLHVLDFAWAAAVSLFTQGPNSAFFVFFVFLIVSAAFLWGLYATVATTAAVSSTLALQAVLIGVLGPYSPIEGDFELNRLIMRATYVFIIGLLIGYIAEAEKQSRIRRAALGELTRSLKLEGNLRTATSSLLSSLTRIYGASAAMALLHHNERSPILRFAFERSTGVTRATEMAASEKPTYFHFSARSWSAERLHADVAHTFALHADGSTGKATIDLPAGFAQQHPFKRLIGCNFAFGQEWQGVLYLFEPTFGRNRASELRFLQELMDEVESTLAAVYFIGRFRRRIGAGERARLARELHDGSIQSLIGLELLADAIRRQAEHDPGTATGEIRKLQQALKQEVITLRELVQQLNSSNVADKELVSYLGAQVQKFSQQSGIQARFRSSSPELHLPPRVSIELARIVQEALVNIRRHSGARSARVTLEAANGHVHVTIDDDGKGFGFSGTKGGQDLSAANLGPRVIQERVQALGGELQLTSKPGEGSRLSISIPRAPADSYFTDV